MVPHGPNRTLSTKLLLTAAVYLAGTCFSDDQYQTMKIGNLTYQQLITPIVVSQNDKRGYISLRLENQMEVLLISDPQADKAAVAMDVGVGTYSNPKSLPGLAHFLEHLLFMGTKKYPGEGDFDKYLESHSGSNNAETRVEETLYYFDIGRDALEGGIDRFSQFFISPLFRKDSVEKEAHAVDSEYKKNLLEDFWRIGQVKSAISNPEHPYSHFGIGNYETLISVPKSKGIVTRDEMIKFYQKFYSADKMKLVVIGKESMSELKNIVIPRFSQVKNHEIKTNPTLGAPFTKDHLGIQINVVPVKGSSSIEMEFLLPSQKPYHNEMPILYIVDFLRHEGTDTLMTQLRKQGLVYGGENGISEDVTDYALFSIRFELTPLGLKHTKKIMELVFSFLRLIKNHGITEEFFNMMKELQNQRFQFSEKSSSADYVSTVASTMQSPSQLNQVIISKNVMRSYNATLIKETLEFLNPHNMRLILSSPSVANMTNLKVELFFGTKFNFKRISKSLLKELSDNKYSDSLKLPKPNPFISKNFSLMTKSSRFKYPGVVRNIAGQTVWYTTGKVDVPKVSLHLMIKNNQWFHSPDQEILVTLLTDIIKENLKSIGYMAEQAGLHYSIEPEYPGIEIIVDGFSDKASEFFITVLNQFKQPNITTKLFNLAKDKLIEDQLNYDSLSPQEIVSKHSQLALFENTWSNEQYSEATDSIALNDLINFQRQNITNGSLELLVVGNFNQNQSLSLMDHIQATLNLRNTKSEFKTQQRTVVMAEGHQYVHSSTLLNSNETNSAIEVYFDMYAFSNLKDRTTALLTSQMMGSAFYNQLRTKEQLGYLVSLGLKSFGSRGGLVAKIQSVRNPVYLESRIEAFLVRFASQIESITDANFDSQLKSLQSSIINYQQTLDTNASRYWDSIKSGFYDFNRDVVMAEQLTKITKSDVINMIKAMTSVNPKRRKISFYGASAQIKTNTSIKLSKGQEVIQDLISWREKQVLSPVSVPIK